jgi:hypothetical protein
MIFKPRLIAKYVIQFDAMDWEKAKERIGEWKDAKYLLLSLDKAEGKISFIHISIKVNMNR